MSGAYFVGAIANEILMVVVSIVNVRVFVT